MQKSRFTRSTIAFDDRNISPYSKFKQYFFTFYSKLISTFHSAYPLLPTTPAHTRLDCEQFFRYS